DEVALVLTVGVVDDDDELPAADGGDRVLDLRERHDYLRSAAGPKGSSSRSTYLATTSVSRVTPSPGWRVPGVVTASVCGINATSKLSSSTAVTVRLIPSTVTDPF